MSQETEIECTEVKEVADLVWDLAGEFAGGDSEGCDAAVSAFDAGPAGTTVGSRVLGGEEWRAIKRFLDLKEGIFVM